ncbi:hypothetical protein OESDEN_23821 [Oesophagostomum dentatum]|uniref:Uncharacterized protein n=1 Tax=Oesophagostomum dentatum TaxID=61180 RepID=A0A0B1RV59_OESDE|nr:hypothetical protein OESDEN_23821 [Oesophagostomum dentatum]
MSGSSEVVLLKKYAQRRQSRHLPPYKITNTYDYITLISSDGVEFHIKRDSNSMCDIILLL